MLLSIKEVAGRLSVGRDSVARLMDRGELQAVEFPRMGGQGKNRKRMVEDTEIERFKEERKTKLRHSRKLRFFE